MHDPADSGSARSVRGHDPILSLPGDTVHGDCPRSSPHAKEDSATKSWSMSKKCSAISVIASSSSARGTVTGRVRTSSPTVMRTSMRLRAAALDDVETVELAVAEDAIDGGSDDALHDLVVSQAR